MNKQKLARSWKQLYERGDGVSLAEALGIDAGAVSNIISGKRVPSTEQALKIEAFYSKRREQRKKLSRIEIEDDGN